MEEKEMYFPKALKQARQSEKISQTDLAEKSGVSFMTMRRYETGESFPNLDTFGLISLALKRYRYGLADAWARDYMVLHSSVPVSFDRVKNMALHESERASMKNYVFNCIQKSSPEFISILLSIIMKLSEMSKEGVEKADEMIELLAKIPEYKNKTFWNIDRTECIVEAKDATEDD